MRREVDRKAIAALSAGHFATDFANGVLPALLPFLVSRFDLSYAQAGALVFASAAASSLVQPIFGHWSDRRGAVWLLPAGVLLSGCGMALAAVSGSYSVCVLLVVVSGLGTAAYHPEGTKFASFVSGHRKASGMSLFSIGGNLGVAFGALSAAPAMLLFGRWGGLLLAVPAVVVSGLLLRSLPYLQSFAPDRRTGRQLAGEDRPGAFAILLGVVTARTVGWFGLLTFVPLWAVQLGHSESYGSNLLSLMLFAGGAGTLAVGPIADRIGRRPVLLASVVSVPPLTLVFIAVGGTVGVVALALVGVCVVGTFGLIQVMTQEYMPTRLGLASGISIGFAIGLGGVAAAVLGAIADSIDLEAAMYISAVVPALAIPLTLLLPSPRGRRRRKLAPEPVV
ncbi:MAG TPA: MFS transporter [Gaiellaceae bacterium]|nr:MFS transporter [Gaiellaceae bacterium]